MRLLLAALLLLQAGPFAPRPARPAPAADVDAAVEGAARKFMADARAVGLSVGVLRGGRSYTYHYGEVAKGGGAPRRPARSTR